MVGETGFEPYLNEQKILYVSKDYEESPAPCPHIGPQSQSTDCPSLARIELSWEVLPAHLKAAIIEICRPYFSE